MSSKQRQVRRLRAPQLVVVDLDALDPASRGQHLRLRLDLLGGKDARRTGRKRPSRSSRSRYRASCSTPSISPRRLISTATHPTLGIAAQQIDRPDVSRVLAADQPHPRREPGVRGQELLEVGLYAVLLQAGIDAEVVVRRRQWTSSMVIVRVSPFGLVTIQTPGSSRSWHGGVIQLSGL